MVPELKELAIKPMAAYFRRMKTTEKEVREDIDYIDAVYHATNSDAGHEALRKAVVGGCKTCIELGCDWKVLEGMVKTHEDFALDLLGCLAWVVRNKKHN